MPTLTRQTTYSSLPPSPRYEPYELGQEVDKRRGFEEALERLTRTRSSVDDTRAKEGEDQHESKRTRQDEAVGGKAAVGKDVNRKSGTSRDQREHEQLETEGEGLSLWDLLRDEVGVEDWDGWIVDGKWERIANFLAVPLAVEKVCLDLSHLPT